MRIPRFYTPVPLETGQLLELPEATFRHAIQVLRLKTGENLILFNGEGGEFSACLETVGKRAASVHIQSFSPVSPESPLSITLAQAIIKPDKMDFTLQKAVELGVTHIQPLITQRSVVRPGQEKFDKKRQHWEGVLISACEQSGRTYLPTLADPLDLRQWLMQTDIATRLVLAPGDYPRIQDLPADLPQPLALLTGPEGGFLQEEIADSLNVDVLPISLGPRILRAETASLVALALLQQRFGDL